MINDPVLPPAASGEDGAEVHIHVSLRVRLSAKMRKEALVILGAIIEQTVFEDGCISCRLYQDVLARDVFMLEEIWANEGVLHRHLRSEKFRTLLLVIEMAVEPPDIRFDVVSRSTGIHTIEKVRRELSMAGRVR